MPHEIDLRNSISDSGYVSPFAGNEYEKPLPPDTQKLDQETRTKDAAGTLKDPPKAQYDNCRRNVFVRLYRKLFKGGDPFEQTVEKSFNQYVKVIGSKNATPQQIADANKTLSSKFAIYMSDFKTSGNQITDETRIQVGLNHILGDNAIAKQEYINYKAAVDANDREGIAKHGLTFLNSIPNDEDTPTKVLRESVLETLDQQLPPLPDDSGKLTSVIAKDFDLSFELCRDSEKMQPGSPTENSDFIYITNIYEKISNGEELSPIEQKNANMVLAKYEKDAPFIENLSKEALFEKINTIFLQQEESISIGGFASTVNLSQDEYNKMREEESPLEKLKIAQEKIISLCKPDSWKRLADRCIKTPGEEQTRMKTIIYLASAS